MAQLAGDSGEVPVFRRVSDGVSPVPLSSDSSDGVVGGSDDALGSVAGDSGEGVLASAELKLPVSLLNRASKHRWQPREGSVLAQSFQDTRQAAQAEPYPGVSSGVGSVEQCVRSGQRFSSDVQVSRLESRATIRIVVFSILVVLGAALVSWFWPGQHSELEDNSLDLSPVKDLQVFPTPPPSALKIAGVQSVSGLSDGWDHPELAVLAVDGKPETSWSTASLRSSRLDGGRGYGLVLSLGDVPVSVRQVLVHSPSQGGSLELRRVASDAPEGGVLLGSAELSDNVVFDLDVPVKASELLLWCTEMPAAPGGGYRLMISEVEVLG